jgi:hypothetical protein
MLLAHRRGTTSASEIGLLATFSGEPIFWKEVLSYSLWKIGGTENPAGERLAPWSCVRCARRKAEAGTEALVMARKNTARSATKRWFWLGGLRRQLRNGCSTRKERGVGKLRLFAHLFAHPTGALRPLFGCFGSFSPAMIRGESCWFGVTCWRRGAGSNRRIKVLQTSALPLGYRASARMKPNPNLPRWWTRSQTIRST